MTPRLLSIFCLCQLGGIGAGWLLARIVRKTLERLDAPERLNTATRLLADYGGLLVLIPIACVLLIPRHREDEGESQIRPAAMLSIALGTGAIVVPFMTSVLSLVRAYMS